MNSRLDSAPQAIARWATETPDTVFVQEADGLRRSMTYAETVAAAQHWAGAFRRLGVVAGDPVATIVPSSVESVACWLGLAWIRALDTGIHPDYRGMTLRRLLDTARTRVAVIAASMAAQLSDAIDGSTIETVVVIGPSDVVWPSSVRVLALDDFLDAATPATDLTPPERQDISCIVFTSGTTGPSKAVLVPWGNFWSTLPVWSDLTSADSFYSPFPMCHAAGRSPMTWIGAPGGTWVVRNSFRTDEFWPDVQRFGCTATQMIPIMVTWLLDSATEEDLNTSTLRKVVTAPVTERLQELQRRLGLRVRTVYGMSEIGMAVHRFVEPGDEIESCGRATPGYEVRIVDELDYDVAPGDVGEAIVRTALPWSLNAGYLGMPEQTAQAWRNGWFHTGDGLRDLGDGRFAFVDRLKDSLRRRGENVSSFELEQVVLAHPAVAEAAVIGVGDGRSDQELKVCVVSEPGAVVDPAELVAFVERHVPRFMVPRYVEVLDTLPRTEVTQRVKKHLLRETALSPNTWDRTLGSTVT